MSASIKKKVSQNRTKLQQTTNNNKQQTTITNNKQQTTNNKQQTTNNKQQTTNNKRPFFLPKINKVFLRPILQNLKERSVFFENNPFDEPNQMLPSQKFYPFRKLVKNTKWWSKSNLPLSHSPDRKMFPFKKVFFLK